MRQHSLEGRVGFFGASVGQRESDLPQDALPGFGESKVGDESSRLPHHGLQHLLRALPAADHGPLRLVSQLRTLARRGRARSLLLDGEVLPEHVVSRRLLSVLGDLEPAFEGGKPGRASDRTSDRAGGRSGGQALLRNRSGLRDAGEHARTHTHAHARSSARSLPLLLHFSPSAAPSGCS
jgi:hypothetical protein